MQISLSFRCVIPSLERLNWNLGIEAGTQRGSPLILSTSSSWRNLEWPPLKQPRRAPPCGRCVCPPSAQAALPSACAGTNPTESPDAAAAPRRFHSQHSFSRAAAAKGRAWFHFNVVYLRFTKMTFLCHLPEAHRGSDTFA